MAQGIRNSRIIRTGFSCNNGCLFCDQGDARDRVGDRVSGEILDDLAQIAPGEIVVFSGGEVTLRDELVDWVGVAARQQPKRIIVQTNGRLLAHGSYVEELVKAGASVFAVALHGPIAPLHDWLTQRPGSFREALRGIRNIRSAGAMVLINCVITRSNFRHLAEVVELADDLGAAVIRFIWLKDEGLAQENAPSLVPSYEMVLPHLQRAETTGARLGRRILVDVPERAVDNGTKDIERLHAASGERI